MLLALHASCGDILRNYTDHAQVFCDFLQVVVPSSRSANPTHVRTEEPAGWAGKLSCVTAPSAMEGRTAATVRDVDFNPVVLQHAFVPNLFGHK